jgi:hypothetical protein
MPLRICPSFAFVQLVVLFLSIGVANSQENARFRVSIVGWKCLAESHDHGLEVDGKGDEVFLMARVQQESGPINHVRTKTMGDVNSKSGRLQAGSKSSKGGIKSGDFDISTAELQPIPPGGWKDSDRTDFPLLVWEGELSKNGKGVAIEFAIWEDDEGGARAWNDVLKFLRDPTVNDAMKEGWEEYKRSQRDEKKKNAIQIAAATPKQQGDNAKTIGEHLKSIFGSAYDRPVGKPVAVVFSYESATNAGVDKNLSELLTAASGKEMPLGLIELTFDDKNVAEYENVGKYQLFVRFQKLN